MGLLPDKSGSEPEGIDHEALAREALEALTNGDPVQYINSQLSHIIAGEEKLRLLLRLLAETVRFDRPQSVILTGASALGKSYLANSILGTLPENWWESFTRITRAAPDYVRDRWIHKIVFLQQFQEGDDSNTSLQVFLTEGGLKLLVPVRGEGGGWEIREIEAKGPLALWSTSVEVNFDPQTESRLWFLSPDPSPEQTRRIQRFQADLRMKPWLQDEMDLARLRLRHISLTLAEKGIRPPKIINIYADDLLLNPELQHVRRHQEKIWGLVEAIAYVRQFLPSRKIIQIGDTRARYILPEPEDVETAITIGLPFLQKTLQGLDELGERLIEYLEKLRREAKLDSQTPLTFTVRQAAKGLGVSKNTLYSRIEKLMALGLVEVGQAARGPKPQEYEYYGREEMRILAYEERFSLPPSLEKLKSILSASVKAFSLMHYLRQGDTITLNALTLPPEQEICPPKTEELNVRTPYADVRISDSFSGSGSGHGPEPEGEDGSLMDVDDSIPEVVQEDWSDVKMRFCRQCRLWHVPEVHYRFSPRQWEEPQG